MGESADGSRAAQGALDHEEHGAENGRGFFGRLLGALAPPDGDEADEPPSVRAGGVALPGLNNLAGLRVEDISVPKVEITAVPEDITRDKLVEVFRESGFSRLPVYRDTLDHPLGLVLLKDFALQHGFNGSGGRFTLRRLLRPVLFVPPSMPLAVLLQKMQSERTHMALVIDEYGGVDGLVTIEDVIEQVIGDIDDEHDTAEGGLWVLEKPGVYIAQSRAPLDEFEHEIGLSLVAGGDEDEVDTLGGLVFVLSGRVPARGEVIRHESGVEFEVIDADPRRIKRLRVRLPEAVAAR
ncbi:hemolysin family protein [Plastorhodobacter daqingensis]|uniref:Hemolysin family protein n=1 Tax=Plastorhodobacter daqingensis TaxID=1387281 RepID=A0ABW2UHX1_9RHOB